MESSSTQKRLHHIRISEIAPLRKYLAKATNRPIFALTCITSTCYVKFGLAMLSILVFVLGRMMIYLSRFNSCIMQGQRRSCLHPCACSASHLGPSTRKLVIYICGLPNRRILRRLFWLKVKTICENHAPSRARSLKSSYIQMFLRPSAISALKGVATSGQRN